MDGDLGVRGCGFVVVGFVWGVLVMITTVDNHVVSLFSSGNVWKTFRRLHDMTALYEAVGLSI